MHLRVDGRGAHGAGARDAEEEDHEAAFGEFGVVDEVGVDGVLEVAAAVVGEENVDCFGGGVGAIVGGGDGVVDGVDDVGVGGEEGVGFDFFEGEGNGFAAEGAADLFEGVEG